MGSFFFKHPLGKFAFDVLVGAVLGAATATLLLPETVGARDAIGAILAAASAGARSAASSALVAAVKALRGPEAV